MRSRRVVLTFWNEMPNKYMLGELDNEQLKDIPCAYWLKAANQAGYLNASQARHWLNRGNNPKDLLIVSEEDNQDTDNLIARGATPFIIYSFESPLYRPLFYEKHVYRRQFKHDWCPMPFVPKENYEFVKLTDGVRQYADHTVAYASAKHWAELPGPWDNPTFCHSFRGQLLQERWMLYYNHAKRGKFHLYGSGWDRPRYLPGVPNDFFEVIAPCLRPPSPYSHKFEQMGNYGHALAVENWSGYATEKAFDAKFAGVPEQTHITNAKAQLLSIIDEITELAEAYDG